MQQKLHLVDALSCCPILSSLSTAALNDLSLHTRVRHVNAGELIYERQTFQDCLSVLVTGRVFFTVLNEEGKQALIWPLDGPTWFGDDVFSPGLPRVFRATAHTKSTLLEVPSNLFLDALKAEPLAAIEALALLGKRTWAFMCLLEDDNVHNNKVRLVRRLLMMSAYNKPENLNDSHEFALTQDELAQFVGMTRQGIRNTLKELENLGLLSLSYGKVSIVSVAKMTQFLFDEANIRLPKL